MRPTIGTTDDLAVPPGEHGYWLRVLGTAPSAVVGAQSGDEGRDVLGGRRFLDGDLEPRPRGETSRSRDY
jgi:hypothetical protein